MGASVSRKGGEWGNIVGNLVYFDVICQALRNPPSENITPIPDLPDTQNFIIRESLKLLIWSLK